MCVCCKAVFTLDAFFDEKAQPPAPFCMHGNYVRWLLGKVHVRSPRPDRSAVRKALDITQRLSEKFNKIQLQKAEAAPF